jgi:solute:Na+ symporter, SSS family
VNTLDWLVLGGAVAFVVVRSILKTQASRGSAGHDGGIRDYVQSGQDARWFTVALSVMATQASAITFLSTPGQAFADGTRFVQFYFGLPLATIVLVAVIVPIYRTLNVFTAYQYLEERFDIKTRSLAAFLFLTQRSLAAGITIYAPSIVLSYLLGWNIHWTIVAIGALVLVYTTFGGTKAVSWAQSYQMAIIFVGMAAAFVVIVRSLPVSFSEALTIAGAAGKLNTFDFSFDWNNRYTFWSGLLGGFFLQLSYFGTDQSQVQRYLTGQSLQQSRLGLLFNGIMKVPMQFVILLLGVLVFVFYQFVTPPIFFNAAEIQRLKGTPAEAKFNAVEARYQALARERAATTTAFVRLGKERDASSASSAGGATTASHAALQAALQAKLDSSKQAMTALRSEALAILREGGVAKPNDTNYVFLTFVLNYLPAGLIGLVIAAILSAAMSSASSEINALASTAVIDVYKRLVNKSASEAHYVWATRVATVAWGMMIILFAQFADRLGSLIEAVNILGSLFYGTILGIFLTAFFVKFVRGTAVFIAALLAEAAVIGLFNLAPISYLWYNLIGCLLVMMLAIAIEQALRLARVSQS